MKRTHLAWLTAALILLTGLSACGGDTPSDDSVTANSDSAGMSREQVVEALTGKCAALSSWAATETITVVFEANGTAVAKSEMTADVTVTPQAFSAVCRQALDDGEQVTNLYSADGRVYVATDDCRYTLELDLASVLHSFGIVPLSGLPPFDEVALRDKLTVTETEGGYTLSCEVSGSDLKGELSELARNLLDADNTTNSEIAGLSVTAQVKSDGTPERIGFTVIQNTLSQDNFFTVYTQVDVAFTATGDAVTLTPPDDLTAYDGAEAAYRAIADAMTGENADTKAYERLTATYGKPLVDSVLYILGVSVE